MFPMTLTLTLDSPGQLNAVMAALQGTALAAPAPTAAPSPAVTLKDKPVPLTAEQQAAVDDTAGLEEVNKAQGKARQAKPAPTATTSPTAEAVAADAPAKNATEASATTPHAGAPAASSAAPAIDYKDLQAAVFKLAGKSRAAALEVNQAMGVKTMKELPPERWADALAAVEAKIAELE